MLAVTPTITPAPVRKSIRVKASPEKAFEVFTAGMSRWWPGSHSINQSPLKSVTIEPRVGGRWFERGEDGSECEWVYRPRLVRHVIACYAARAAGESWFCRTVAGAWNPCRSMSQVVL